MHIPYGQSFHTFLIEQDFQSPHGSFEQICWSLWAVLTRMGSLRRIITVRTVVSGQYSKQHLCMYAQHPPPPPPFSTVTFLSHRRSGTDGLPSSSGCKWTTNRPCCVCPVRSDVQQQLSLAFPACSLLYRRVFSFIAAPSPIIRPSSISSRYSVRCSHHAGTSDRVASGSTGKGGDGGGGGSL